MKPRGLILIGAFILISSGILFCAYKIKMKRDAKGARALVSVKVGDVQVVIEQIDHETQRHKIVAYRLRALDGAGKQLGLRDLGQYSPSCEVDGARLLCTWDGKRHELDPRTLADR
ncbi:MAG: hypothetical protein IT370_32615 [Deltaproteobacteria bacterium]|nr:hypothetical protein [Deltaproteobacteria bacterium]